MSGCLAGVGRWCCQVGLRLEGFLFRFLAFIFLPSSWIHKYAPLHTSSLAFVASLFLHPLIRCCAFHRSPYLALHRSSLAARCTYHPFLSNSAPPTPTHALSSFPTSLRVLHASGPALVIVGLRRCGPFLPPPVLFSHSPSSPLPGPTPCIPYSLALCLPRLALGAVVIVDGGFVVGGEGLHLPSLLFHCIDARAPSSPASSPSPVFLLLYFHSCFSPISLSLFPLFFVL
ncbi:hypothetical protein FB45DRAFT_421818 [Roridomyces roridus]|uniref:Uncharacterized protein n=1 Tax=Roridomyces roridus TaxID=1738132 RepID=A0AAD7C5G4_9AGAR|nr:hypothetical protein FB45DRAFT_421818 [Roridomyces roridus]